MSEAENEATDKTEEEEEHDAVQSRTLRIWIAELLEGEVKSDDISMFLETPSRIKARRIWVVGTVVGEYSSRGDRKEYRHLKIDDGTGVTLAKAWGDDVKRLRVFEPGDLASITGRPRRDDQGPSISVDTAVRVDDFRYEVLLRLKIVRRAKEKGGSGIARLPHPKEEQKMVKLKSEILEYLKEQDERPGVSLTTLKEDMADHDATDVERALIELMQEGTVYEPRKTFYRAV